MRRDSLTVELQFSDEQQLILANALEMYPEAVSISAEFDLCRYDYNGIKQIGRVDDGNIWSDREGCSDLYPGDLAYYGYVHIDYKQAALHLEQAPDEWTQLDTPYNYGPVFWRAVNHVPKFGEGD